MQTDIAQYAAATLLHDLREQVEVAAGIAKAAHVLADAGLIDKSVAVANDVDEEIYAAETLLGLVSAVARSAGATAATDGSHDAHTAGSDEPGSPIDATLANATIRTFLAQADARLERALGITRAADICVAAGKLAEGVTVALDIEPLLYDARHLVNTASLVRRLTEP